MYDVKNGYLWVISSKPIQTGWGTQQLFFRAGTAGLNSWQIWIRTKQTTETSGEIVDSNRWSRWSMLLTDNGAFTLNNGFYMKYTDDDGVWYRKRIFYPFGKAYNDSGVGMGLILCPGGRMVIASGDCDGKAVTKYSDDAGIAEDLSLLADSSVVLYTGLNDVDNVDDGHMFLFSDNGYAYGPPNTNYTHLHYRNSKFATSKPSSLDNGAICYVYE